MLLLNNLSYQYPSQTLSFSLEAQAGEIVAILGSSGAGKSTLLALLAGTLAPSQGEVSWQGHAFTHAPAHLRPLSMLFQEHNLFSHLTTFDNIGLGLNPTLRMNAEDQETIRLSAEKLGLADLLGRKPSALSGGQKQRVALARCLARKKPILLLDEPFSALDAILRIDMLDEVKKQAKENNTCVMMVTHQQEDAERVADQILKVENGKIQDTRHETSNTLDQK